MQAFDFIRQFRLDVLETKYPGVTKVRGSSRLQTAYRLEKEADLVVPTRCVSVDQIDITTLFEAHKAMLIFLSVPDCMIFKRQEHLSTGLTATVLVYLHFPYTKATQDSLEHYSN